MRWRADPPDPRVMAAVDAAPPAPAPDDYWARLAARLPDFGITRVADITGLDHVGLPVVQAVRPAARSNAVTQGKAATLTGAAIGAVLECLEMAAGEDPDGLVPAAPTHRDLWRPLAPDADWPRDDTPHVSAWDLGADAPASVPRDLLSTDFARGAPAEAAPILRHSIGLGAGPSLAWAASHGLWECIEADARLRADANGHARRIAPDPDDRTYGALLARIHAAGLRAALWHMPAAAQYPAVRASVMENPGATALPLPAVGYAARADAPAAIAAALAEALQTRLAVISGAREDITQRFYHHGQGAGAFDAAWAEHATTPGHAPPPSHSAPTLTDLARQVGPVYVVPLHWDPDLPLAITRVIAPNLVADPFQLEQGA